MARVQKITANLWFDNQAEEAATYYVSIFKNSKIETITRYGKEGFEFHHKPEGSVMTVSFRIEGQEFIALNGGSYFKFNEAISFIVNCDSQDEVDYYWDRLVKGGEVQQCGWLKDKFGVSWQIVPSIMDKLMSDPDADKSQRVMKAMMQMKKLDIDALKRAFDGK